MTLRRPSIRQVLSASLLAAAAAVAACSPKAPLSVMLNRPFAMDSLGGRGPDSTTSAGRGDAPRYAACADMKNDSALTSHFVPDSTRNFLLKNGYYTWCIPEYHDVQRFRTPGRGYGPIAASFASSTSSFYTDHTSFDTYYINVAIVDVSAGDITPAYNHLNLTNGHNCVFLTHEHTGRGGSSGPGHWKAAIGPPVAGTCFGASSSARDVPVDMDQPYPDAAEYPPVTRFIEASNMGQGGPPITFLSVRCANAWCSIGRGGGLVALPSTHSAMGVSGTTSRWIVPGWSDDQHWGVPATGTLPIQPHTDPASIVPVDNLSSYNTETAFDADWIHVAHVNVPRGTLPAKYLNAYALTDGSSVKMWIKRYPPRPGSRDYRWYARFGADPHNNKMPTFRVDYTPHPSSSYPPAWTARWRWRDTDEDIWVACAAGCCFVEQGPVGPGEP